MNTGNHSTNNHSNVSDGSGELLSKQSPNLMRSTPESSHHSMQSEQTASKHSELPFNSGLPPIQNSTQNPTDNSITPVQSSHTTPSPSPVGLVSFVAPSVAADDDLIEKEWVLRAKAIVAKTKDDPHQQNKELNLYKADYIKKRYNKDIKVSEG